MGGGGGGGDICSYDSIFFIYDRISNGLKQQLDLKTSVESSLDPSRNFYMILSLLRLRAIGDILRT